MTFELKKWLSYFIPMQVFKIDSKINKTIEINWNNGKMVLDTENTNYSYGSLQRILKIGLQKIGFTKIKSMEQILILGVAGGSVVKTLVNEVGFTKSIIGVEIDTEIIKIANHFFELNTIKNFKIINENAYHYMLQNSLKFDLIIIDVFEDTTMPDFLYQTLFINRLSNSIKVNGVILFNTMSLTNDYNNNLSFKKHFNNDYFRVNTVSNLEKYNQLIIIDKIK